MKKTLIALAALASTAAFAQSSVTLYGKANVGVIKESGSSATMKGGADGSDSRIGFRGTEDLGGGLKAGFTFESGLNPATGSSDSVMFQRQAFVSLGGSFGEVRLGRQYTVGFGTSIGYIPSTYTSAQLRSGLGFNSAAARDNGQIRYISPNFGGVTVHFATQLKSNATNEAALTELAAMYKNGPIAASIYTSKVKDGDGSNVALNGSYNFGSFLVAAGYVKMADNNRVADTGTIAVNGSKGAFIHVGGNFGPFAPYLQYAKNTETKQDTVEIGGRYAMSKRTGAYVHASTNDDAAVKTRLAIGLDHNF